MSKLIILSIVIVSMGVPAYLSTARSPRRGLKRAQTMVIIYVFIWGLMCLKWYPQLVPLK